MLIPARRTAGFLATLALNRIDSSYYVFARLQAYCGLCWRSAVRVIIRIQAIISQSLMAGHVVFFGPFMAPIMTRRDTATSPSQQGKCTGTLNRRQWLSSTDLSFISSDYFRLVVETEFFRTTLPVFVTKTRFLAEELPFLLGVFKMSWTAESAPPGADPFAPGGANSANSF